MLPIMLVRVPPHSRDQRAPVHPLESPYFEQVLLGERLHRSLVFPERPSVLR
jgi:hypothetical protein